MRELFVYYHIREDAAAQARAAVATMQRELRAAHPGLVARLLTRRGGDGSATWMETYALEAESGSNGIDGRIEAAIAARASLLPSFTEGPRHVEAFESDEAR